MALQRLLLFIEPDSPGGLLEGRHTEDCSGSLTIPPLAPAPVPFVGFLCFPRPSLSNTPLDLWSDETLLAVGLYVSYHIITAAVGSRSPEGRTLCIPDQKISALMAKTKSHNKDHQSGQSPWQPCSALWHS